MRHAMVRSAREVGTSPDPTAHHQLVDVERTIQNSENGRVKTIHEIHPQLSAERVMSCVTSIHIELDSITGYSPVPGGHGQLSSNHDGAKT